MATETRNSWNERVAQLLRFLKPDVDASDDLLAILNHHGPQLSGLRFHGTSIKGGTGRRPCAMLASFLVTTRPVPDWKINRPNIESVWHRH